MQLRISRALQTFPLPLAVFLMNAYVCRGLFGMEYVKHMGSIEGAYIGISRYAMTHWRDLSWFPLWYDGIPYQNTYPPLLHWGVAFVAWLFGFSPAHAHHWVGALAYCLGPVFLYTLALRLTGSRWAAFAAGAIYSAISWSAWLVPAIAADMGSPFYSRRLQSITIYGDAPHISAVTLLPLALLLLDLAFERRRAPYVLLAALGLAAVVLTNWLGAFALALMVFSYLFARTERDRVLPDLVWMAVIAAAAYCLAMPWAPPSTIAVTQFNAKSVGGDYLQVYKHLPQWSAVILVTLAILKAAVRRLAVHLQFAIFFAFLTSLLTLTHSWWNISIVPQGNRYHIEMDLALSLLAALVAHAALKRRPHWVAAMAIGLLVLASIYPVRAARRNARDTLIQGIDITRTTEWRTAQWLNQHWSGERVLMPGSSTFWLNAFTDTPQVAGGFDQGVTDYMIRVAIYGIYFGTPYAGERDGEITVVWLKALGVQAVGVSGPRSKEFYHPFMNPKKFEGLLEPLWRDGDDVIYQVGPLHASLARVIPRSAAVTREPKNGIDVDPLRPYVAALENPEMPHADFRWTSAHSARITTDLRRPDELVSVQIAWHKGWHAIVNGQAIPVRHDALGLMLIEPNVAGPSTIDLNYDGGAEMRLAHWLSGLTAIVLVGLSVRALRRSQ